MKIIGLDISTNCTGWAVIEDGKLLKYGYIKTSTTKKRSNKYIKIDCVVDALKNVFEMHKIEHIYIEEILHKFKGGKSSARSISSLAKFNGSVSYKMHELFITPIHIDFKAARKHFAIRNPTRLEKKRKITVKNFVLDYVKNSEPNFKLEFNRNNNIKSELFDAVDAIVIAKYAWHLYHQKDRSALIAC